MNPETETPSDDDLREEYDETVLKNGVRGKYVQRLAGGMRMVRLAPDVAPASFADSQGARLRAKGK